MLHEKKKWGVLLTYLLILLAISIGCSEKETNVIVVQDKVDKKEIESDVENEEVKPLYPLVFNDGAAQEVTIEAEPKKIITLLPSNTEIAFALGLGERIIGVGEYANYPVEVAKKEKVGSLELNVEKVLKLNPDLILVSPYHVQQHKEILEKVKAAGIGVVAIADGTSFEGVYESIRMVAQVTNSTEKAEEIIADMKYRLEAVKEKAKSVTQKKKVWIEVDNPLFTVGKDTLLHEMLEYIQATNVAADQKGWSQMTEDAVLGSQPDVIITTYGSFIDKPVEGVLNREGWSEIPAVKNKQVYDMNSDLLTRQGPRLIDGSEQLAALIYPEVFDQ
jgi:iron complex transport system substrate-binding protein